MDTFRERMIDNLRSNERIMPLYQIMAHCLDALENSAPIPTPRGVWDERWQAVLDQCVNLLPQGSGFDEHPRLVKPADTERLIFAGQYHPMDAHGSYMAWVPYRVVVKPSFLSGLKIAVAYARGELGQYVHDSFHAHLTAPYDMNKLLLGVVEHEHVAGGVSAA